MADTSAGRVLSPPNSDGSPGPSQRSFSWVASGTGDHQIAMVNTLLDEKDRLIRDKDELVESKNRLWKENLHIIRGKDAEIESIKEELEHEKAKVDRLMEGLKRALRGGREANIKGISRAAVESSDDDEGSEDEDTGDEDEDETDDDEEEEEFAGGREFFDSKPQGPKLPDAGQIRSYVPTLPDNLRAFGAQSQDKDSESSINMRDDHEVDPPPSKRQRLSTPHADADDIFSTSTVFSLTKTSDSGLAPASRPPERASMPGVLKFKFIPLIRIVDEKFDVGHLHNVPPSVVDSISTTFAEHQQYIGRGRSGIRPTKEFRNTCCAYFWMRGATNRCIWTTENSGSYACKSCFNHRRACLRWQGNDEWMILPVPPRVRGDEEYIENRFYVFAPDDVQQADDYPGIWEASPQTRKNTAR